MCDPVVAPDAAGKGTAGFLAALPGVLSYPVRGRGKWLLGGGAIFFCLVDFLRFLPLVGPVLALVVWGYLCSYMLKIIARSAAGENDPPDWPDLTGLWDDVIRPALFVLVAGLMSFAPLVAYVACNLGLDEFGLLFTGSDLVFWTLVVFGCLYMPMSLITLALYESLAGLNPVLIVGSIIRTVPSYPLVCGILVGAMALSSWTAVFANGLVPVIGPLVGWALSLYFLLLEMHVLGKLYQTHEERLGWFRPRG